MTMPLNASSTAFPSDSVCAWDVAVASEPNAKLLNTTSYELSSIWVFEKEVLAMKVDDGQSYSLTAQVRGVSGLWR